LGLQRFLDAVASASATHASDYGLTTDELQRALITAAYLEGGLGEEAGVGDSGASVGRFQFHTAGGHGSTLINQGYTREEIADDVFQANHWAPILAQSLASKKEQYGDTPEAVRQAIYAVERPLEIYPKGRFDSGWATSAEYAGQAAPPSTPEEDAMFPAYNGDASGTSSSGPRGSTSESGTITSLRAAEDAFYNYRNNSTSPVRIGSNGSVEKWVTKPVDPAIQSRIDAETDPVKRAALADILGVGDDSGSWVPDLEGQRLYNTYQREETLLGRVKEDGKAITTQIPAVRSYLDVEMDKSSEITRQANDFQARTKLFSDLLADEQQYSVNADNANIQNAKAMQSGLTMPNAGGFYAPLTGNNLLSQIVRPSIPDYLAPDYRLNKAVGLPGPEGFDDPDYPQGGSGGVPQGGYFDPLSGGYGGWRPDRINGYAFGTQAAGGPPPGVDPELAGMVGKPADFVPLSKLPPPTKPWPFGVQK